nr:hypothetical protein [Tanacetum cinerariifolium]
KYGFLQGRRVSGRSPRSGRQADGAQAFVEVQAYLRGVALDVGAAWGQAVGLREQQRPRPGGIAERDGSR